MGKKKLSFKSTEAEAEWWIKHQDVLAKRLEKALATGKVSRGSVERLARERQAGASPTITIRLPEEDLTRARRFAAEKGLRYQTYLKMLLHQALDSEEATRI